MVRSAECMNRCFYCLMLYYKCMCSHADVVNIQLHMMYQKTVFAYRVNFCSFVLNYFVTVQNYMFVLSWPAMCCFCVITAVNLLIS